MTFLTLLRGNRLILGVFSQINKIKSKPFVLPLTLFSDRLKNIVFSCPYFFNLSTL